MAAGTPVEADVRRAVREALAAEVGGVRDTGVPAPLVLAAVSGGADSLALAAALSREAGPLGLRGGAVIVDHGLQPGSAQVAATAAARCRELGLAPVEVVGVSVRPSGEGTEAAARTARYTALDAARRRHGAAVVLLGHTRDDQAEQVLLGLTRGAGARSLSGMPRRRGPYLRPLLGLPRATTVAACAAAGLDAWQDPMNADPRFARVRARRAVVDLDADLGPGVAAALSRSADLLRDDADLLDTLADEALAGLDVDRGADGLGVPVAQLVALHPALRSRVLRTLLTSVGAPPGALGAHHVAEVTRLLTRWRGQGPLHLPGGVRAGRSGPHLHLAGPSRVE